MKLKTTRRSQQLEFLSLPARYENEIPDAHEERKLLLDALGDAFLLVDSAATVRFANAAARELFSQREPVGRTVRETFLEPRPADALLPCLENGESTQSRVVLPQQASPRSAPIT